jgi:hypothetical protein
LAQLKSSGVPPTNPLRFSKGRGPIFGESRGAPGVCPDYYVQYCVLFTHRVHFETLTSLLFKQFLDHGYDPHKRRILDTAMVALWRATGIESRVDVAAGQSRTGDAILEIETDRRKHTFGAEIKTVDRFETPAMLKTQSNALRTRPLLVAPYITRLVYVVGHARPAGSRDGYRALNSAGPKVTFALLCLPELLNENYRKIALDACVALGR